MHDPNKSKVLCVVAKASYWSLTTVGWVLFGLLVALMLFGAGLTVYQEWSWAGIGRGLKGLALVIVFIGLPIAALLKLHSWAKGYSKDC